MKKGIGLIALFMVGAFVANAQTQSLTVSKGVQHVANKKSFEDENARKSQLQANSVEFPAIVVSKGVAASSESESVAGNIQSKGIPAVAVSKGVAQKSLEKSQNKSQPSETPGRDISNGNEISKK
jgi:F0F1-type ATP synthase membrane subunit c/vacuolar-type H+-ATPase subunit K